jgi:signal peptidase I
MKKTLRFLLAFLIAFLLMMVVRLVGFTIYTINGAGLEPTFQAGDRVMVNRWSYGLRVGGNRFISYSRLWRDEVQRGDIVAVNDPQDTLQTDIANRPVLLLRCRHLPGESVNLGDGNLQVPGRLTCADQDYYLMEPVGREGEGLLVIPEDHIIGRAFLIVYSHEPGQSLWDGWRTDRFFAYFQ